MSIRFVNIDRDTPLLLPPDLREWVPANHLAHFILDAVESIDLRQAKVNTRGTGDAQDPPTMLLGLLVYSYATGVFGCSPHRAIDLRQRRRAPAHRRHAPRS